MRRSAWFAGCVVAGLLTWALVGCFVDPVHDEQVAALGPEPAGESPGPLHRPGQPCLVCHGGLGPAHQSFSVAGTVFAIVVVPALASIAPSRIRCRIRSRSISTQSS